MAKKPVDGTKEIFEGGPTEDQVETWKKEYGNIYLTDFDGDKYVWRTLRRTEYKKIMNIEGMDNNAEWSRQEKVSDMCVLWPEDYDYDKMANGDAGRPTTLSDKIMNKSGFAATVGAKKL